MMLEDLLKEEIRSIFISWIIKILIVSALIIGYMSI